MRIAVLGPCSVDGIAPGLPDCADEDHPSPLIRSIVDEYISKGHSVELFKFNRFCTEPQQFNGYRVRVTLLPRRGRGLELTKDLWKRERQQAVSHLGACDPDVAHAHWTYEYARIAIVSGFPHLITAHDVPSRLFSIMRPRVYWWPRLLQGYLIARRAQVMTGQSPYTVEAWQREMGRRKRMEVVPNALPNWLLNLPRRNSTSLTESPTFVSIANGFSRRKNTTTLLKAFSLVRNRIPRAKLILYGHDHGPGEVAALWAQGRGLHQGVSFQGQTPYESMLLEIRDKADVMVHSAIEESFGMAVAEGMALGLPVVGGASAGAVPWLLDQGGAGILCDVRSVEDLSAAMLRGLERPELGLKARQRVLQSFSVDFIASKYLEILKELSSTS